MRSHLKKSTTYLLAASLMFMHISPGSAGMVGTQTLIDQAEARVNRDRLNIALRRAEVRTLLAGHGVTLVQAQQRIEALTDAEVSQLAAHFDDQPAGGIIEVIIIAALIVVILELVGVTDIFSKF